KGAGAGGRGAGQPHRDQTSGRRVLLQDELGVNVHVVQARARTADLLEPRRRGGNRRELIERQPDADRRIAIIERLLHPEDVPVDPDIADRRSQALVERAVDVREVVEREEDAVLRPRRLVFRDLQDPHRRCQLRGLLGTWGTRGSGWWKGLRDTRAADDLAERQSRTAVADHLGNARLRESSELRWSLRRPPEHARRKRRRRGGG